MFNFTGRSAALAGRLLLWFSPRAASAFADWYGRQLLRYPNHLRPLTWQRIVRTPQGMLMRARFQEVIGRALMLGHRHEPDVVERIERHLRPGGVFVDVGANIGYYTMLASALVGSGGRVVAFEPAAANLADLAENVALNRCGNVVICSCAASDTPGVARLTLPQAFNSGVASLGRGSSSQQDDPFAAGFTVTELRRVDEVIASIGVTCVDVVKIDAEGHEPEVLRGMERCLRGSPNVKLAVELSPASYSVEALRDYLFGMGFRGEFEEDGRWVPLTADRVPRGLANAWFWRDEDRSASPPPDDLRRRYGPAA